MALTTLRFELHCLERCLEPPKLVIVGPGLWSRSVCLKTGGDKGSNMGCGYQSPMGAEVCAEAGTYFSCLKPWMCCTSAGKHEEP